MKSHQFELERKDEEWYPDENFINELLHKIVETGNNSMNETRDTSSPPIPNEDNPSIQSNSEITNESSIQDSVWEALPPASSTSTYRGNNIANIANSSFENIYSSDSNTISVDIDDSSTIDDSIMDAIIEEVNYNDLSSVESEDSMKDSNISLSNNASLDVKSEEMPFECNSKLTDEESNGDSIIEEIEGQIISDLTSNTLGEENMKREQPMPSDSNFNMKLKEIKTMDLFRIIIYLLFAVICFLIILSLFRNSILSIELLQYFYKDKNN